MWYVHSNSGIIFGTKGNESCAYTVSEVIKLIDRTVRPRGKGRDELEAVQGQNSSKDWLHNMNVLITECEPHFKKHIHLSERHSYRERRTDLPSTGLLYKWP